MKKKSEHNLSDQGSDGALVMKDIHLVDEAHVLQIFVTHVPISKAKRALKRDIGFQLVSQGIFSLCETPLVVRCRQSSAFQQDDSCRRCKEMIC